jgi:hypothetical protein
MGSGLTTVQLRAALQSGFGNGGLWWITKTYSYPFLNDPDMTFASPLATLIMASKPFIFLPISQLDDAQYKTAPAHGDADGASLATVYTMIARAVGISDDVNKLKSVAIDRYFWRDGAQQVKFAGPVTTHATLLADKALGAKDKLDDTNVVGELKKNRLVILHGSYDKEGGGTGTHWLLGTLFALDAKSKTAAVVGNDPWIGQQVMIDPKTRTVTSPENFPLANFKVDGYQSVKILN